MAKKPTPKVKDSNKELRNIILLLLGFALGYYMLNYVATWEKPPLGNTFHIVMGCAIMAVTAIALGAIIKKTFFPSKPRRKKSRHVFLDDSGKRRKGGTPDA